MSSLRNAVILICALCVIRLFSQDSISILRVLEAVGDNPPASVSHRDSISDDTLSIDFLYDIFSVFDSAPSGSSSLEPVSILDFMTDVYSSTGFYDTGCWDTAEEKRNLKIFDGSLSEIGNVKFSRPVKGRMTSSFGLRPETGKIHYGVDLAGKVGDTIMVALPGIVTKCGFDRKGYGWYVCVLDSIGLETRYAHMSRPLVKKDDRLHPLTPVGLVGSTGNSTGPHLHFEIRYKGKVVNPMLFLEP